MRVKVVKNKVAPPFREAIIDLIYGKGIVRENELFNVGLSLGLIVRKGSWMSYVKEDGEEISLGQGKNNAVEFLKSNPDVANELENRIRESQSLPLINAKKNEDDDNTTVEVEGESD